jgi:uncharacterized delta-60 repeat protein
MKKIIILIILTVFRNDLLAQTGSIDLNFNPSDAGFGFGDGANNTVRTTALQPDGKLLIGGEFTTYNGTSSNYLTRLNADGSLDAAFNPGTGANGFVRSASLQPDGKILVGGAFTSWSGTAANRITRLNPDGSLDVAFNPGTGANNIVENIAQQPDGKILVGGTFTSYNGTAINRIARLNPDGSLDVTFNPGTGANGTVLAIALQPDGKILIGGGFTTCNGTARNYMARLNPDGIPDLTFNTGTGGNFDVRTIALQPDGKIIIGGIFTIWNGATRNCINRLNGDGSPDTGFNPGTGAIELNVVALLSDGKILVGGGFTTFNGTARSRIARLNSNGSLDITFNPGTGAGGTTWTIAVQSDGKIIIGGIFTIFNGTARSRIARVNADGSFDPAFYPGTGANANIRTAAIQPDGKMIIVGSFTLWNNVVRNRIARLNSDGSLDAAFNPGTGANIGVRTVSLQPDGKIILGGMFTDYNGTTRNNIARVNADGSLDAAFNPGTGTGTSSSVETACIQPDGKIIIGGSFSSYNGTARSRIARLNADGSLDATFNPGTGANNTVSTIALQPDGKIIIGGAFTGFNGTTINRVARLNPDGTLDATFNPGTGANNILEIIALQPNGKTIIGGAFTTFNGTARSRIARLNADGTLDASFIPGTGANSNVQTICLQPEGKIIIGGTFTNYNGMVMNRITGLNAEGTLDAGFNSGAGASDAVNSIALQPDGKILIAGSFTSYNGTGRNRLARLLAGMPPEITSFSPASGCAGISNITITGNFFSGATAVSIGGTAVNSFTVNSATEITATVGSGTTGTIQVSTPSGSVTSSGTFTVIPAQTWYLDADDDNYYTGSGISQCSSPGAGYKNIGLLGQNDCNDSDPGVWRTGNFYTDVDGDGYTIGALQSLCYGTGIPAGYSAGSLGTDCDDSNPSLNTSCASYIWTGTSSGDWNTPLNWSSNLVPNAGTDVLIPAGTPNSINSGGVFNCKSVTLRSGAMVTIGSGGVWNVKGDIVSGPFVLISGPGKVVLNGTDIQNLNGIIRLNHIDFANTSVSGVVVAPNSQLQIEPGGVVSFLPDSRLNTNGNMLLTSSATGTAKIGPIPASAVISGEITQERYLPYGSGAGAWYFLGSPFSGKNFTDFVDDFKMVGLTPGFGSQGGAILPTTNPERNTVFKYDEPNHHIWYDEAQNRGWVAPGTAENVVPGSGYRMWVDYYSNSSHKFDNKGTLTRNDVNFPLSHTVQPGCIPATFPCNEPGLRGWNLLANPYPCDIDWNLPSGPTSPWEKPGTMNDAFYTWNSSAPGSGYRVYVTGTGTALGVTESEVTNPNIIPSGQGFFVYVTSSGTPSLIVRESAKSTTSAGTFSRMASNEQRIKIRLTRSGDNDYQYDAMLRMRAGATDQFDLNRDAQVLSGPGYHFGFSSFGSMTAPLVLQTIEQPAATKVIPMEMDYKGSMGTYKFRFTELESLEPGMMVYLKDNYTGELIPLDSDTEAEFLVIDESTATSGRFELILQPEDLTSVAGYEKGRMVMINPNPSAKSEGAVLVLKGFGAGQAWLQITDMTGRVISSDRASLSGSDTREIRFPAGLPAGVYTIKIQTGTQQITRKWVVK